MQTTLLQFLIVCPLVFLGGFVDAIAGGGGLISLPAYLIAGLPVHMAIGTNKLSSMMGTSLTTYRFAKSGYIKLKLALVAAVAALLGSTLGAKLALLIDDSVFKIIMLVILPLTAFYVLKKKAIGESGKEAYPFLKTAVLTFIIALVIGVYDGFYGPGTGTFLLLLLTGVARLSLNEAAGTTKVANLSTNVAALIVYIINGKTVWLLGLVAGVFGIAGNYLGSRAFTSSGSKFVRPIIIVVLSVFFVKVLLEVLGVKLF